MAHKKIVIYWEGICAEIANRGRGTDATPRDVPLHPGAEKWYREHGFTV